MSEVVSEGARPAYRPWLDNYPPNADWQASIDTTPIHERVLQACATYGDKTAIDFLGARTSYAELGRQINAMTGALQKRLGVTKGTRVALMMPNCPFYAVAYYAVLKAGGTVVACNPLYTLKELSHITGNAGADLMVTVDLEMIFGKAVKLVEAGHVKKLVVAHFPDALPGTKGLLFKLFRGKELARPDQSLIADRIISYKSLLAAGERPEPVAIDTDRDVAVQQYTGGTTGVPKGAMLSHANIAANADQSIQWWPEAFQPTTTVIVVLPFFHIFAMTTCLNGCLRTGVTVCLLPRYEAKTFFDAVRRMKPNLLVAVPSLCQALANAKLAKTVDMSCIKITVSGGAPLSAENRRAFGAITSSQLKEGYGLTECSPVVACTHLSMPDKQGSIGQPIAGTDVRLLDVDDPKKIITEPGVRGEIAVRGPQVMLGYFTGGEPDLSSFEDGYLRTGDVGVFDEDGYIFIVDRIKDLIISSGFNVYPRNIEDALYEHPAVEECNVIGVPDPRRGEVPVAFIKLHEGQTVSAAELRTFLEGHLSRMEMPKDIIFKDELPKTLIGKLSKKELREEYAQSKGQKSEQA